MEYIVHLAFKVMDNCPAFFDVTDFAIKEFIKEFFKEYQPLVVEDMSFAYRLGKENSADKLK